MAEKGEPAAGWPIIQGDFHAGNPKGSVAVISMGSHLDEQAICDAGAAIAGSCKTENLGLEKVIANIISNPNIRYVITCGTEVKGHLSGQSFIALHDNGVEGGKIVGSKGAIPFIENLSEDHIKRFQEQVEIVDVMETEDIGQISAKIKELEGRGTDALAGGPMVVEIKDDGAAAGGAVAATANPQFLEIEAKLDAIETKLEFVDGEMAQRVGRKVGRDIGILYGIVAGLMTYIIITDLLPKLLEILA